MKPLQKEKLGLQGWEPVFSGTLLLAFALGTYVLFYRQAQGLYPSDMAAYLLEIQGEDSGIAFPYPLFFKLGAVLYRFLDEPATAAAMATALLNSLSVLLLQYYLRKEWLGNAQPTDWQGAMVTMMSLALMVANMLILPDFAAGQPQVLDYWNGVAMATPWHNATYLATRPFSILVFFQFYRLLGKYETGFTPAEGAAFAVSLLLTTLTKPSFSLVFVSTAGVIMVWRLLRVRFKNVVQSLLLGLCFLPTFADLLYQYSQNFVAATPGEERGIGFGFGVVWRHYTDNLLFVTVLSLFFPLVVLAFNYKAATKNSCYLFSLQILAMGFAQAFFLYEKGPRIWNGNFDWGYCHGVFFAYVGAALLLLQNTRAGNQKKGVLTVQWLAFAWQTLSGLYYLYTRFA